VLQNMRDPESRQHLPARRGIRSNVPPQVCAPAHTTKANWIVDVRPSCQLEKGNRSVAPLTLRHRRCGAFWLLDEIAIIQPYNKAVAAEEFQVWKLAVRPDQTATLTCDDGRSMLKMCFPL
jgi:hypothetical protein